jgi:FkbM family methyltransferase
MSGYRKLQPSEYQEAGTDLASPFGTYAPSALQAAMIRIVRATPLHRGFFRNKVARLIRGNAATPIDIEAAGAKWRLHGDNNLIELGLMLHPAYNAPDIKFLTEGAPPGSTFVDIGCNIGLYTLACAQTAGTNGRVIAIDANPLMAARLRYNVRASGFSNVSVFDCAVSDTQTRADLSIAKEDVAIVAIAESEHGAIAVRTLADILSDSGISAIHGLKIDIEGHEDKALAPYLENAPESGLPKRIVIETAADGDDYPACKAAFAKRGYELAGRTRQNSFYTL